MIEYRSFHNSDPPRLVALWHACRPGRGVAEGFSFDALEMLVFSQTYFDRHGLIVAVDEKRVVGFIHAGFGANDQENDLCHESGVICMVMVHPEYRRQGIGRELVAKAETYLRAAGTRTVQAGPAAPRDPFYIGLYGGSELSGFLESDPDAAPFFNSLGYDQANKHLIFQRNLGSRTDPISIRLVSIRRKMEITISDQPEAATWWWHSRFGRLDSLRFHLVPKAGGPAVASATVVGLDLFLQKWQERAIGINELIVADIERRKGYGQTLVLDICRRLREEKVTLVDAHVPVENSDVTDLLKSAGFEQIDVGWVYLRTLA